MPSRAEEAELVRLALLEQQRWERQANGAESEEEDRGEPAGRGQARRQRLSPIRSGSASARETRRAPPSRADAVAEEGEPPIRARELSVRLAAESQRAADAAAEIAARLSAARAAVRSAAEAEAEAQRHLDEVTAQIQARHDSTRSAALSAEREQAEAALEVQRAAEEVEQAQMQSVAADELRDIAVREAEAAAQSWEAHGDGGELSEVVELLEEEAARATAAALAAKAAHGQARAAVHREALELERLTRLAEESQAAATLAAEERAAGQAARLGRAQELAATIAELQQRKSMAEVRRTLPSPLPRPAFASSCRMADRWSC